MSFKLKKPFRNGSLLEWATDAWEHMRRNTLKAGPGIQLRESTSGTVISAKPGSAIASVPKKPLQIVGTRPAYVPVPATAVAEGSKRFYLTWGTVNGVVADNWDDHFDFSPTPDGGRFFFAKATFSLASDSLKVASWEILTGSTYDAHETPEWEAGGVRPEYYVFSLGSVYVYTPEATEEVPDPVPVWSINPAPGSVMITEHVTNIGGTGTAGEFMLTKQLSHYLI